MNMPKALVVSLTLSVCAIAGATAGDEKAAASAGKTAWTFKDDQNRAWTATVQLTSSTDQHWELAIHLERSK